MIRGILCPDVSGTPITTDFASKSEVIWGFPQAADQTKFRDASAVASGNTGEALIDEILLEKRKELFGEIGIGFLDVKRAGC